MRPANDPDYTDPLKPLPLLRWRSLRIVLTMDGRFPLTRVDKQGNARISAAGYVVIALAIVFSVAVAVGVWRTL